MKARKVVVAAAAAGISVAASAQSSVTLYGSVDAGIGYNSNVGGHSQWEAQNGNSQPDRWGLRGVEDLGGGLRAVFQLESGFSTITGAANKAGSIFNRLATVGLSSDKYGTLTLGHMPGLAYAYVNPLDSSVLGYTYENYHPGNLDELVSNSLSQLDNVVRYETPVFRGLQGAAQIGLSNSTNFAQGRSYGYGLRYDQGPIRAALTYSVETDHQMNALGTIGFSSFQGVPETQTYIADHVRNIAAAVNYRINRFTLHALYTNVQLQRAGYSDTFQTWEAGGNLYTSPFNLVDATAYTSTLSGVRWTQAALNDIYFLSKSTQVYAGISAMRATGGALAVIYSNAPSSNGNQIALRLGIHHSF